MSTSRAAVGFSITAPTSTVERVVSHMVGGLGAVHQYVTMLAWEECRRGDAGALYAARLDDLAGTRQDAAKQLVAGVIYNDFPVPAEIDADGAYVASLVPIDPMDADYITNADFLWQPSADDRWATGAVYKQLPGVVMALAGIRDDDADKARRMLALRTAPERTHYHFLRQTADETDEQVVRQACDTAAAWFRVAVKRESLFVLGHIWHMVQDSFSPAHTARSLGATDTAPYGTVDEVYFFGNQTDAWHSAHESWRAVEHPSSEGGRRVRAALAPLAAILRRWLDAVYSPDDGTPDDEFLDGAVDAFREFMRTEVFARPLPPP